MSKQYSQKEIIDNVTSFLCSACDDKDDDVLWVIFEAVRLHGYNQALKEKMNNES